MMESKEAMSLVWDRHVEDIEQVPPDCRQSMHLGGTKEEDYNQYFNNDGDSFVMPPDARAFDALAFDESDSSSSNTMNNDIVYNQQQTNTTEPQPTGFTFSKLCPRIILYVVFILFMITVILNSTLKYSSSPATVLSSCYSTVDSVISKVVEMAPIKNGTLSITTSATKAITPTPITIAAMTKNINISVLLQICLLSTISEFT